MPLIAIGIADRTSLCRNVIFGVLCTLAGERKNAEIGYTLPKAWTKKAGLSTVRFYLQGVNLLTFSDFDLWDPELEADYGNQYPTVRTVTLGVNLNF